ncbi:MAG: SLBB domain-containing protein [Thermodesulfobacteriota bacterium]|nr:SLBB domain-containing protein [Thermodesulfobacteriota bacterium]
MQKTLHPTIPYLSSKISLFFIFLFFCLTIYHSPSQAKSDSPDKTNLVASKVIDNGDLLYVIIPREVSSEFSPTERNFFKEKVEVDRHGYIFLPSQGNIKVTGFTTEQISKILTNNLPKYLSKSDMASVNLIEKRHYIQILGHVVTPGWYNIPEAANIQAILSQAGGILEDADLSKVSISRRINGKTKKIPADIQQYLLKGDTKILPKLKENDTVFIPLLITSENISGSQSDLNASSIRIFGAINSPGSYPAPKGMSLLDLLIMAQGESDNANLTNIKILRADGGRDMFNMQALLDAEPGNKMSFPIINEGDIVHIARETIVATDDQGNPISAQQTFTITGPGSNSRGLRPFSPPITPLEAIAQAGGMNDFADTNDIFIIRRVDGKQKNLPYNYDKALEGEEPDVDFQLKAGDILFIP